MWSSFESRPCGIAMPPPTPVVPRRSRSRITSKICRSDRCVTAAARLASSCSACFLLPTRSLARTESGPKRSPISISSRFSVLAGRRGSPGARSARFSFACAGIDPADISVGTPVDHIEPAVSGIAKHQRRRVAEIEPHYRLADGESWDFRLHLGDDEGLAVDRRVAARLLGLFLGGEHV